LAAINLRPEDETSVWLTILFWLRYLATWAIRVWGLLTVLIRDVSTRGQDHEQKHWVVLRDGTDIAYSYGLLCRVGHTRHSLGARFARCGSASFMRTERSPGVG